MATFHELTPKSSPSHPTQGYCPYLLAHGCEPAAFSLLTVLALKEGVQPVRNTPILIWRYCRLRRFTVPHNHGMWLVLFNSWSIVQTRTSLNRHRRGYATTEAATCVHFSASGPIGLARSQFLNFILSSSLSSSFFPSHNKYHQFLIL